MDIKRIDVGIDKIERIYHIADIHFRLIKRHDEYRLVLQKFYDEVKKIGIENSIIVIAGDVVHSKLDLSPEIIEEASNFLRSCADLCPTILIAGNHDTNLSNKSRLDSLSPIVKNLNHSNLHYLKNTGVYRISNCLFNNMSVFDDPETYINAKEIPKIYTREVDHVIGLFHGAISGASTDIGYTVSNRNIPRGIFDGHHIVLCGDIHKMQIIQKLDESNDKPIVQYPGSMLQQNHGESMNGHGFSLWDVDKRSVAHVELPNEYGFYTIEIRDGELTTDISDLPKKPRLRIKCFSSDVTEVKRIVTDIRKLCDITEITYIRSDDKNTLKKNSADKVNLSEVTNVDFQNKLIVEYIKRNFVVDDTTVEIVQNINSELNNKISSEDTLRNVRWIPKTFEFDNMFSYGEDNIVDFSKMKDVMGLFAQNASGKSSLMDALSFCLFDKSSRAFKAVNVMNNEKMSFKCKFNFEIDGIDYFVERKAVRNKKGDVKVDVEFWKMSGDEKISLNGEARRGTNDIIRDYLGSYDDFILTALSLQNNGSNFIDKGQSDRKDLLAQFMGINIFDKLYNQASEDTKEVTALLKNFNKDDFTKKLADTEQRIEIGQEDYNDSKDVYDGLLIEREKLNSSIIEKSSEIIKLNNVSDDLDVMESKKKSLISNKDLKIKNLDTKNSDIDTLKETVNFLVEKIILFDQTKIEEKYNTFLNLKDELSNKELDVEKLKTLVTSKIEKLKHLDQHEYDPKCSYCMNNIFVKDAIRTREELENDKKLAIDLVSKVKALKSSIENFGKIEDEYDDYIKSKKLIESENLKIERMLGEIKSIKMEIDNIVTQINSTSDSIKLYFESIEVISKNKKIENEISVLKKRMTDLDFKIKKENDSVISLNGNLQLWNAQKKEMEDSIEKIKNLENKFAAYQYYLSAVKRDGIPFELITKTIPSIESEVNNILSQIVEFGIILNVDDKNINANIVYEDKCWPLELSSGMERFISSLAIRVALINVSNLPRPNFIGIDEGWGSLDSNNMSSVLSLLTYLKTQFDFIIIISHLDVMRDFVDSHVEIKKENGFSKVVFQ